MLQLSHICIAGIKFVALKLPSCHLHPHGCQQVDTVVRSSGPGALSPPYIPRLVLHACLAGHMATDLPWPHYTLQLQALLVQ